MKNQDLTYLNGLAISCLATGLVDTAQPAFELISDAAPEHAAGPIWLASVELARGNYNEACKILEDASAELKGTQIAHARYCFTLWLRPTNSTKPKTCEPA